MDQFDFFYIFFSYIFYDVQITLENIEKQLKATQNQRSTIHQRHKIRYH